MGPKKQGFWTRINFSQMKLPNPLTVRQKLGILLVIKRFFRDSVQGVKSLGGHFACLCRGFESYEVKKNVFYFSKRKWKYFYTFYYFLVKSLQKEQTSTNLLL